MGWAGVGGLGSIGAGALQVAGGALQGVGGGGFDNFWNGLGTLGAGATISKAFTGSFFPGSGASGYRTVSQRATDTSIQNASIFNGGALDSITSFLQQLGPKQVSCPGGRQIRKWL
jgi:hypothetical protein